MAMFDDLQLLRDSFVMNKNPFFVVKGKGGDILLTNYDIEDVEMAGDELVNRLSKYGDIGEIKIYQLPKVPKNAISKLQIDGALVLTYQKPRKAFVPDPSYQRPTSGNNDSIFAFELIKSMQDENRQLRDQYKDVSQKLDNLIAMQQAVDESDDDDDVADQSQNNFLGALMGNPNVQSFILNLVSNVMGGNKQAQKPTAMAGTDPVSSDPESVQMEMAQLINTLLQKGVTIHHLRKLVLMDDAKIQMLLSML